MFEVPEAQTIEISSAGSPSISLQSIPIRTVGKSIRMDHLTRITQLPQDGALAYMMLQTPMIAIASLKYSVPSLLTLKIKDF
jgi:hypothetical protein